MSGGANLPSQPQQAYQYQSQPQADAGAIGGIGSLNTNPNASYASGAATQAGNNLTATGQSFLPYAQQTLQTGFDPQNALYAQQFQQSQDQNNVAQAQSGVANTPYGAGITDQNNQNFNINWQNQQLGRQQTAANTASTLSGAAGNAATTGTGIGQSVSTFNNQAQQQQIQDFLAYLQGGTGATSAASSQYGTEANASIANQGLSNQALSGLGSLGGNLLGMFL
jgi:hypothetical protein